MICLMAFLMLFARDMRSCDFSELSSGGGLGSFSCSASPDTETKDVFSDGLEFSVSFSELSTYRTNDI